MPRLPKFKNPDGILSDGRHYFKCPLSMNKVYFEGKTITLDFAQRDKGKNRVVFVSNGEYRSPKKGEYYFSGDTVYRVPNDLPEYSKYWIAVPVAIQSVTIESVVPIQS